MPSQHERTADYDQLEALIGDRHPHLSNRLKDIAEFVLANPSMVALETVATVAEKAGATPSALVRFAQAMGFDGFSDMQRAFRTRLVDAGRSYAERLAAIGDRLDGSTSALVAGYGEATIEAIHELVARLPVAKLDAAAELLARAPSISIVAQRRSFGVAAYLDYALLSLGLRTELLHGLAGSTSMRVDATPHDAVLLAVSFKPYAAETIEVLRAATKRGQSSIVITDSPLSPLLPSADIALLVRDPEIEGVRSLGASMSLAVMLVIATGKRMVDIRDADPPDRGQVTK